MLGLDDLCQFICIDTYLIKLKTMKSIRARFVAFRKKNPYHGDYICLVDAVVGQNFTLDTVNRGLSKLVSKDEHDRRDKKSLIDHLMARTKCTEEHGFEVVTAPRRGAKKRVEELHKAELVESPVKKIKNNYYCEND